MLVKNKQINAKTYRESSQRSTFLKENNNIPYTAHLHTNTAVKLKNTESNNMKCSLLPATKHIQVTLNPMPLISQPTHKNIKRQRHVEFDDERYISYIPYESHYDNSPSKVEALSKLYNTEGLVYSNLSITKQDILLEKEIGIIKMMGFINSDNTDEKTVVKPIETVNVEEVKEENKYQFSTQWVDEWDILTSKQKNLVYKQIVEVRKRPVVNEISAAKHYSQHNIKFPQHKKQTTFLISENKTLLGNGEKETKGKRIVQHLLAHYQKYKSARSECK